MVTAGGGNGKFGGMYHGRGKSGVRVKLAPDFVCSQSSMKLQHLNIGTRFEYEGKVYVKTGPITASAEDGGQRVIPRYAVLRPLDLPEPAAPGAAIRKLDPKKVRKAFDLFYASCSQYCPPERESELAAARAEFLLALR